MKILTIFVVVIFVVMGVRANTENDVKRITMQAHIQPSYPYGIETKGEWYMTTDLLTRLVYWEARGEDEEGWALVVYSVLTRLHHENFPDSIVKVVYQPATYGRRVACQYDALCLRASDFNSVPAESYRRIYKVVAEVLYDKRPNPCPGAIFYRNPETSQKPYWDYDEFSKVRTVGNHVCHRDLSREELEEFRKI